MKATQQDKLLQSIRESQAKVENSENNLQYIKALKALNRKIQKFAQSLTEEQKRGQYAAAYKRLFYPDGHLSFYERVVNSILDYQYGERPF